MDLKLNIYKKGEVVKTLSTSTYELTLGVCEDLINLLGLGKLTEVDKEDIKVSELSELIVVHWDKFIELLHEVFPDLTEEDHRGIRVIDLKEVIVTIGKDTFKRLFNFNKKSKN